MCIHPHTHIYIYIHIHSHRHIYTYMNKHTWVLEVLSQCRSVGLKPFLAFFAHDVTIWGSSNLWITCVENHYIRLFLA